MLGFRTPLAFRQFLEGLEVKDWVVLEGTLGPRKPAPLSWQERECGISSGEVLLEWQSHTLPNVFRPLQVRVWQGCLFKLEFWFIIREKSLFSSGSIQLTGVRRGRRKSSGLIDVGSCTSQASLQEISILDRRAWRILMLNWLGAK